jgi:hypothetical protein
MSEVPSPGYWYVTVEPFPAVPDRVPIDSIRRRIEQAKVSLRGWDYPHIDRVVTPFQDGIECQTDWDRYREHWRFHFSGLFTHRFRLREDGNPRFHGTLHMVSSLWTITEVWEFTKRLFGTDVSVADVRISFEVGGLRGRHLSYDPDWTGWMQTMDFSPQTDVFQWSRSVSREELFLRSAEKALDCAQQLFHLMGAEGLTREVLAARQGELLNR